MKVEKLSKFFSSNDLTRRQVAMVSDELVVLVEHGPELSELDVLLHVRSLQTTEARRTKRCQSHGVADCGSTRWTSLEEGREDASDYFAGSLTEASCTSCGSYSSSMPSSPASALIWRIQLRHCSRRSPLSDRSSSG